MSTPPVAPAAPPLRPREQFVTHVRNFWQRVSEGRQIDDLWTQFRGLIENYLLPLLGATRTKYFQYKGKVRDTRKEEALEIRRDALELALRIKGSFAPIKTEDKSTKAVSVIVLDVPRPPREHPPDTVIEIASESLPVPVPMTRCSHFQGIFSSSDTGVCPKTSRNFFDGFFFRLRTLPLSITTSCS